MGCASSKQIGATAPVVVYRPPPSSFAVFDINAIEEPWLKLESVDNQQKPSHLPAPLLEKLDTIEKEVSDGPRTWDEVSKALEDLKKPTSPGPGPSPSPSPSPNSPPPKKSFSFHTLDELDGKPVSPVKKADDNEGKNQLAIRLRKTESTRAESNPVEPPVQGPDRAGFKTVKANPFILKDRLEREKEGKEAAFDKIMKAKRDPLSDFPELCPPGGAYQVVLYTTSLGGVRRTFEDCNRVRAILENHRVVFDERDVSLHGEFRSELREVVGSTTGEGVAVPKLFVKGRCLGGAEEVVELNEAGRLGRILSCAGVERGAGWQGCEGCGGARFVPCWECGGSCKVKVGDNKERCPKCNENGLVHCPRCH